MGGILYTVGNRLIHDQKSHTFAAIQDNLRTYMDDAGCHQVV